VKKTVSTDRAPAPVGPYSQGVISSGRTLFVAGQIPRNPANGQVAQDFRSQAVQCLENIKAIVESAGATMADVVKVNAYLADLANFPVFNEVYATYFMAPHPARTTVGAVLPGGSIQVEIDAVVALPK
jgi:2-iminobutanoate/2-iminopropanoate deaminase